VVSQGLIKTREGQRTAYLDILLNTDACRDDIQRGELDAIEEIMRRSRFDGMQTINQSLLDLVNDGRVEEGPSGVEPDSGSAHGQPGQQQHRQPHRQAEHGQTSVPDFGLGGKATPPGVQLGGAHRLMVGLARLQRMAVGKGGLDFRAHHGPWLAVHFSVCGGHWKSTGCCSE
jgi:hypothetical protein